MALKRAGARKPIFCLLGSSVFGDGLGALGDRVSCQLTGYEQSDSGLDIAGLDDRLLVVLGYLGGLGSDTVEHVAHKRVHDVHGLAGDAGVGVDLLEDLPNVGPVGLVAFFLVLLTWLTTTALGFSIVDFFGDCHFLVFDFLTGLRPFTQLYGGCHAITETTELL